MSTAAVWGGWLLGSTTDGGGCSVLLSAEELLRLKRLFESRLFSSLFAEGVREAFVCEVVVREVAFLEAGDREMLCGLDCDRERDRCLEPYVGRPLLARLELVREGCAEARSLADGCSSSESPGLKLSLNAVSRSMSVGLLEF